MEFSKFRAPLKNPGPVHEVPPLNAPAAVYVKGELENYRFTLERYPLHREKFLMVSVLSNSLWLLRNLKICPK